MTARTVADVIADLRDWSDEPGAEENDYSRQLMLDAADMLERLDIALNGAINAANRILAEQDAEIARLNTFRPECPTCDGSKGTWAHDGPHDRWDNCPDCVDGKVTWERMAARRPSGQVR